MLYQCWSTVKFYTSASMMWKMSCACTAILHKNLIAVNLLSAPLNEYAAVVAKTLWLSDKRPWFCTPAVFQIWRPEHDSAPAIKIIHTWLCAERCTVILEPHPGVTISISSYQALNHSMLTDMLILVSICMVGASCSWEDVCETLCWMRHPTHPALILQWQQCDCHHELDAWVYLC